MACSKCEARVSEGTQGQLLLAVPFPHAAQKIRDVLADNATEPFPSTFVISISSALHLEEITRKVLSVLTQHEQNSCRAIMLPEGETFTAAHLINTVSFAEMVDRVHGAWLVDLIKGHHFTVHFHPIVELSNPTNVFAHECLLRGLRLDGSLVSPAELFSVARSTDQLYPLDREARLTAIREAAKHDIDGHVFINFNPTSIYDPKFCLQSTLEAVRRADMSPDQIVFEFVESDDVEDTELLADIVTVYRGAGCKVALDDLGSGYGSLNLLTLLKPDFVKLDLQLVRNIDTDSYKQSVVAKIQELATEVGSRVVAEGIETPAELAWLQSRNVDLGQGYLFARPENPPPTVMGAAAATRA